MRIKFKLMFLGIIIALFMIGPGQNASAEAATRNMNVTLDLSEMDNPDNFIKEDIAEAIGCKDLSDIKITNKKIIERKFNVNFKAKFTYMQGTFEVGDTIIVTGSKKGDELEQQIEEALKAHIDRIEEITEILSFEAQYTIYDVTYQYTDSTPKTDTTSNTSQSKMKLNVTSAYLCKGETLQLKLKNPPKKIEKIVWESENKKVVTVSKSGKVTAAGYGSAWVDLTVYAGGKDYLFMAYITVYKLNGFEDGITKLTLYRGEGNIDLSDITAWLATKGAENSMVPYAVPYDRVKIAISSTGDNLATIKENKVVGMDGITYLNGFIIETYRDGVVTITVSDKKTSCKLDIVIGTGVSRLDPVEAIKKNDFTGYEGDELKTMQKIRDFIDEYDLYSESMSTKEKISHIVDYFIETYKKDSFTSYGHGTLYNTMIVGEGVCGDYSETVCFLCDCLGINNVEEVGIAGGPHSWNRVEVDGKWYYLDAYWCACVRSKKTYFLSEELWLDHVRLDEDSYYDDGDIAYINSLH